jgi:hypothetical protein
MSIAQQTQSFSQGDVSTYIEELASELARLAQKNGMPVAGYLLQMAQLEARTQAGRNRKGKVA